MHFVVQPLGVQRAVAPIEDKVLDEEEGKDLASAHIPADPAILQCAVFLLS